MSLTITVPDSVPSLLHSSVPWVPSSASKNMVSPTTVNEFELPPLPPEPGTMSLTITVPDSVPSLFHSSVPWVPSLARK